MQWEKKGLIFKPVKEHWWMQSHCQLPVALPIGENTYRIYFAARDERQYSHVGFFEIDIRDPHRVLRYSKEPVLLPGDIGYFDEHGVYPASIISKNNQLYLYYIGWNKGCEPPLFYAAIGLAVSSDDGLTFRKYSRAPIFSRNEFSPCLVTAPYVFPMHNGYAMLYTSGLKWERDDQGRLRSFYHLKYTESDDGISWQIRDTVAIDFCHSKERDISRACVIKEQKVYKAWYAYNTVDTPYRIGYAESADARQWKRLDHLAGIDVSPSGFDSDMICYPYVIKHADLYYMFYNGNRFGYDGIALATAKA
ncbi:MAG: hypothetical protein KatS3mg031_1174 [Chitinophagales bacterium]|nr:MAG: hypothetical protein KatS3mg031_1174 [Chitinophagales bacterium]